MVNSFTHSMFGKIGSTVCRLGLSGTNRPGKKVIYKALDEGINAFFCYGFDFQTISVLRDVVRGNRDKYVIATGAYNLIFGHPNLRRTLEKRLRQLGTDYIDVFLYLGVMKEKQYPDNIKDEFCKFREEGKALTIGISCHDRKFVGRLADEGTLNAFMMRYNAAHRGAEQDIFPYLSRHNPGIISYTATRWGYLLRRPKNWPKEERIPTASMCYRFVLSNENVDVCLMAPSNEAQLIENLTALHDGPLSDDDMVFMRRFGDAVHDAKKYFM
jgi:aryl-alcohol dehydrogenase-like predicted oxidoreductase